MVEAPLELQKTLTLPQNHLDACAAGDIPAKGNAAGNTDNLLDLTGENAPPKPLPGGYVLEDQSPLPLSRPYLHHWRVQRLT